MLAQDPHIVPIPGTKRRRYLEENLGALQVKLNASDLATLNHLFPPDIAAGERYSAQSMQVLNG